MTIFNIIFDCFDYFLGIFLFLVDISKYLLTRFEIETTLCATDDFTQPYVSQDIRESTNSSSSENRLLVAEFGLLDAQLANLKRIVSEMTKAEEGGGLNGDAAVDIDELALDEDELEVGIYGARLVLYCRAIWGGTLN